MSDDFYKSLAEQQINVELLRTNTLKTQMISQLQQSAGQAAQPDHLAIHGAAAAMREVTKQRDDALQALKEAHELTKEWVASMEAWRDLAQTLRDEIKACPNHEAHTFGKDKVARDIQLNTFKEKKRVESGLKPRPTHVYL